MSIVADVRHALRLLARSPIFAFTSLASLALGIAATAAIFSLADALLLRPRPGIANPATVVDIGRTTRGEGFDNFGYPLFRAIQDHTRLLEGVAAQQWAGEVMSLGDAHASERVFATLVSWNYFALLGTRAQAGRFFLPEEDRTPGTHPVAVLNHHFWMRRFGGDRDIVGQTIRLNNLPFTVVGVAEQGFTGTTFMGADLWVPMAMDAHVRASDSSLLNEHGPVWMTATGRMKPGVTTQQVTEELNSIMRAYMSERGDERIERWGMAATRSARIPALRAAPVFGFIGVLGLLTTLVLLIACSNVAGMLLARALGRRREFATRLALGATRSRLVRQLLLEGLCLALLAAAASVLLTWLLVALLASYLPDVPVPIAVDVRIDIRVLAFAFLVAALSSLFFSLLPALRTTRVELASELHGATASPDRRRAWLRQGLVAAQVAMALLLLVAAGLFTRSLQQAAHIDSGFNVQGVDTLQIDTRIGGYRTDEAGVRVVDSLIEQFQRVPGVTDVAASRMVPLQGSGLGLGALRAPGSVGPDGDDSIPADWDVVSPDYFKTLQLRIVQGRPFTGQDRRGAPFVAIINETFAARVWPGQNPIGKTLRQSMGPGQDRALEIVGVARDASHRSIAEPPRPFIFVPLAQQYLSQVTFYVRRSPDASRLDDLRAAVVAFDPMLPVIHTQTLEEATAIGLLPQRLAAWIAGSVGMVGLLLAALGLYGVTAFSVAQRMREIAIRIAVGASYRSVLWMVLRQSGWLALVGMAVGLGLAVVMSTMLRSLLIGLQPVDPLAYGLAIALLAGVMLAASWTPARRAATMDPYRALRTE